MVFFIYIYKDTDEQRPIHSKSDNRRFMIYDNADEGIEKRFELRFNFYQIGLETSMGGSDFIFDCVYLLYYKCHKIKLNLGESYIDSHDLIKKKKTTISPINKINNKCFQCAATVTLYHEKIGKCPERISKINLL